MRSITERGILAVTITHVFWKGVELGNKERKNVLSSFRGSQADPHHKEAFDLLRSISYGYIPFLTVSLVDGWPKRNVQG